MRILLFSLITLIIIQSCQTKSEHNQKFILLNNCDELDIAFYGKDSFTYKTIDRGTINLFVELISSDSEKISDTCGATGEIIYKSKGQKIFEAQISTTDRKPGCEYVTYILNTKRYRHRLTYRQGMAIDEIYWEKVDPMGNLSTGRDRTKYR